MIKCNTLFSQYITISANKTTTDGGPTSSKSKNFIWTSKVTHGKISEV